MKLRPMGCNEDQKLNMSLLQQSLHGARVRNSRKGVRIESTREARSVNKINTQASALTFIFSIYGVR